MFSKDSTKKTKIILDYVTVSYREIFGVTLVLLLGFGAALAVWYLYFRQPDPSEMAQVEIRAAQRSLSRAATVMPPDREDLAQGLARARDELAAARELARRAAYEEAINAAQTSQRLSTEVYQTLHGARQHVAILTDVGGNVDYQRQNSQSWMPAANGVQLYPGDKVRTLSNSGAKLRSPQGTIWTLEENMVMHVPEPGIDTRTGRPEEGVFIQRGFLTVESPEDAVASVRTPEAEAKLPGAGILRGGRNEGEERTEIEVTGGEAQVRSSEGEEFTLEENRGVVLNPTGVAETFHWILPPELIQPPNGRVFVVEEMGSESIDLAWEAVPNAEGYRLEISRLRVFTGNVHYSTQLVQTSATVPNPPYGTWWWRVISIGPESRRSLPSQERSFKVRRPDQAMGEAPSIEVKWPPTQLGHKVLLEGTTDPGTLLTVSVNDASEERMDVDPSGRFSDFVNLTKVGSNVIVLRAQSPSGVETTKTMPPLHYETY